MVYMRKTIVIMAAMAIVMAIPALSWAGPFLVCDPQAGVTSYKITGLGAGTLSSLAISDGSMRHDLASISSGTYNITVAACTGEGTVWEVCSTTVPFSFTKPSLSAPSSPAGVKLTK
jgi:hypothetical protein